MALSNYAKHEAKGMILRWLDLAVEAANCGDKTREESFLSRATMVEDMLERNKAKE